MLLVILGVLFSGCASIPKESVTLSMEVGNGIKKQYESQISLVNLYFSTKREKIDLALEKSIEKYFEVIMPKDKIELSKIQLKNILDDINSKNKKHNLAKEELEKARIFLIEKLTEEYLVLNRANLAISGLLQSAVNVDEARSTTFSRISDITKEKINLNKVFAKLDELILDMGEDSTKLTEFLKKVEEILNRENSNE